MVTEKLSDQWLLWKKFLHCMTFFALLDISWKCNNKKWMQVDSNFQWNLFPVFFNLWLGAINKRRRLPIFQILWQGTYFYLTSSALLWAPSLPFWGDVVYGWPLTEKLSDQWLLYGEKKFCRILHYITFFTLPTLESVIIKIKGRSIPF